MPIPEEVAAALEGAWSDFLKKRSPIGPSGDAITNNLGPRGRRLLHLLAREIANGRIQVNLPQTFVSYGEALDLMGIPRRGRAGQQLKGEGLSELNDWTKEYRRLPKIAGLIIDRRKHEPSGGYALSHGKTNGDWRSWWRNEAAKAIRFNWSPYLRGNIAPRGPISGDVPKNELPKRLRQEVTRLVRDTRVTREIKALYGSTCQFCGTRLQLSPGEYYSEAHHLKPLGGAHNGPDIRENVICVCPNCHARLDYKSIQIKSTTLKIRRHSIRQEFIDYHNRQCR